IVGFREYQETEPQGFPAGKIGGGPHCDALAAERAHEQGGGTGDARGTFAEIVDGRAGIGEGIVVEPRGTSLQAGRLAWEFEEQGLFDGEGSHVGPFFFSRKEAAAAGSL